SIAARVSDNACADKDQGVPRAPGSHAPRAPAGNGSIVTGAAAAQSPGSTSMNRRHFCRSAIAAGIPTFLTACNRTPDGAPADAALPEATSADTAIPAISLDGREITLEKAAVREL